MTMTLTERLVTRIGGRATKPPRASRRGFLGGAAVVGAALAVNPWGYLVRPASAYDAVCGTQPNCADGYSVFCCTINGGSNTCPPDSFIGGWWKADNSSFCGGSARYYIDCNAYRDRGSWQCRCAEGTCDQRRVACNQFRYGQCRPDIPASNTGPVVCRMVSCTPPWQQFGGVCSSSSATDNRTATHAAPCLTGRNPIGSLDVVGAAGGALRVLGWAYDPDESATEIQVAVYLDGAGVGWFPTGRARDDVNAAFGISGRHGFDLTIPAGTGRHTVDVFAINVGGGTGNPLLGSGSATIGALPRGFLDSWVSAPSSTIRVRGWAYDPDEPGTAIQVAVYRGGVGVGWFPTGRPRPDVNSVFGITGNHGFDFSFDSPPGEQRVEVYAINVGGGEGNPLVGRGQLRVGVPMGYLDTAAPGSGSVRLSGWAYDPDQPDTAIPVAVYRDGVGVDWFPTGGSRPDVNAVFGISGNHGFGFDVPSPPGQHRFEVYAINVGPAAGNPLFAATTVNVR